MIDFRILLLSYHSYYILLITHYRNSDLIGKKLEIDSSCRKHVANPPNIGNIVEVATTSFLNSFTCNTVAVRAGLKTKVCSASVISSCVCNCLKHQASSSTHPHDSCYRLYVTTCLLIFNATTQHYFRPLDTISWCRVSVPVSDLPGFVLCRGGEHDPNHVMSGGIIH